MKIEKTIVTLGEEEYEIVTAPFARSRKWRPRLAEEIKPLFDQMAGVQGITFDKPEDLLGLWPVVQTILVDGIDKVFEMLLAYAPELAAARVRIEATATEKQIMVAFQEVLKLADPFGLFQRLGRQIGPTANGTLSSSQQASGALATTKLSDSPSTTAADS